MRALFCLLLSVAVASCGSSTEPTVDLSLPVTSTDIVGSYNLVTANGTAPPFPAFTTSTQDWTLEADTISIAANNTWVESTQYFVTNLFDNTTTTQFTVVSGTYAIASGKINFTMTQGGSETFTGSVTGATLMLIYSGKRFVYAK